MKDTIEVMQAQLVQDFALFDDWMQKYEYLIELGAQLDTLDDSAKNEENRIHGCQSQVWLNIELVNQKMRVSGASDAAIVSGLIALIVHVYDDQSPEDIVNASIDFLNKIGFSDHLSPTRSNGLYAMLQAIFEKAQHYTRAH